MYFYIAIVIVVVLNRLLNHRIRIINTGGLGRSVTKRVRRVSHMRAPLFDGDPRCNADIKDPGLFCGVQCAESPQSDVIIIMRRRQIK